MGLGSQLIAWPQLFVDDLVKRGFRVIRFDNRDCGLSTHLDVPACIINPDGTVSGDIPYGLENMADDTKSLLNHLLGNTPVHVVGASMGGMIAQRLTIDHPTRVKSLCSIMSTTGNPLVGWPEEGILEEILKPPPPDIPGIIAHMAGILLLIGSKTHPLTPEEATQQATEALMRVASKPPPDPYGTKRQMCAIRVAVDRTKDLKDKVTVPTLVIHGREDPLINISGGQATAEAIPEAVFLSGKDKGMGLAGMGHDLPAHLWTTIADAIEANVRKAGA